MILWEFWTIHEGYLPLTVYNWHNLKLDEKKKKVIH